MKKIIIIAIIVIIACVLFTNKKNNRYELEGTVFEVNKETTFIKDYNGNIWEIENIVKFEKGQKVTMIMDNNGTKEIEDDIIEVLTLED